MRILHVLNHALRQNGNVHVAVDLACEQRRRGHVVGYASEGGDLAPVMEAHGVELFHLDQTRSRFLRAPEITYGLISIIRKFKPDIVHAHMMTAAVAGWMATRVMGVPLVTHIHNSFDKHSSLMRFGDRIIAVSEAVARNAIKERGMAADRVRVVMNGSVCTERLPADPGPPAGLMHPNVGTVCGQHPRKGVDHLIRAMEKVYAVRPETHFYIVGEGPFQKAYEEQAAAGPAAANIHFLGALADPRPMLSSFDIFALASLQDPCPLVIGEARWAGCAVVATNVDGIPETLDGGASGSLVPPADPEAMAQVLLALLNTPEALAGARLAARTGADRFRVERVNRDVEAVYGEVVRNRAGASKPASVKAEADI